MFSKREIMKLMGAGVGASIIGPRLASAKIAPATLSDPKLHPSANKYFVWVYDEVQDTRGEKSVLERPPRWSLPKKGRPGSWMPRHVGPLVCDGWVRQSVYVAVKGEHLVEYKQPGKRLFEVEWRGDTAVWEESRTVPSMLMREARLIREMNWNRRMAFNYALDCSELKYLSSPVLNNKSELALKNLNTVRNFLRHNATQREFELAQKQLENYSDEIQRELSQPWMITRVPTSVRDCIGYLSRDLVYLADEILNRHEYNAHEWITSPLYSFDDGVWATTYRRYGYRAYDMTPKKAKLIENQSRTAMINLFLSYLEGEVNCA